MHTAKFYWIYRARFSSYNFVTSG